MSNFDAKDELLNLLWFEHHNAIEILRSIEQRAGIMSLDEEILSLT